MEPLDDPAGRPPVTEHVRTYASWRDSPWACAAAAIVLTGLLGAALMALSINRYGDYGWVLFCLAPCCMGFLAVLLHEWARPAGAGSTWSATKAVVGSLAALFSLGCLLILHVEGLICIAMALPVVLPLTLVGAMLGAAVVEVAGRPRQLPMLCAVLVLYPAAQEAKVRLGGPVAPRLVTTQLEVAAPPARVWAALRQPVQYPAATGWFRAGVTYPVSTAIGTDAAGRPVLWCRYSRGLARLPVVAWRPGQQLAFAVPPATMPAPMREISPYPELHAPHLHGYFQVDSGTFRLRALPGGRTLLEARTVYRHAIGPRFYWQLWSDYLLDEMHQRVLTTLKAQAENPAAFEAAALAEPLITLKAPAAARHD